MNSKELKEQSRENIKKQMDLIESIEGAEKAIKDLNVIELGIYLNGSYVNPVLVPDDVEKIQEFALKSAEKYLTIKEAELEKLLGICKPAAINPEFEAATKDMFESVKKKPDPVEDKLTGILQEEAKKIEAPKEDKSLDKYPATKKRGRQADYPEGMTKDTVQKMYQDEGKTINELAKHFGIPYSKMSNFITRNHLHRTSNQKTDKPDKQPEETERP